MNQLLSRNQYFLSDAFLKTDDENYEWTHLRYISNETELVVRKYSINQSKASKLCECVCVCVIKKIAEIDSLYFLNKKKWKRTLKTNKWSKNSNFSRIMKNIELTRRTKFFCVLLCAIIIIIIYSHIISIIKMYLWIGCEGMTITLYLQSLLYPVDTQNRINEETRKIFYTENFLIYKYP